MASPFLLDVEAVRRAIRKEPNTDSLYELLVLASPSLTKDEMLQEETSLNGAEANLIHSVVAAHPELVKEVQDFMDQSRKPTKKRKTVVTPITPTSNEVFPVQFHIQEKWPFLDMTKIEPSNQQRGSRSLAALQCINARGAIAHEQLTERFFKLDPENSDWSVETIFEQGGGGVKRLLTVDAIKQELIENGPVVSTTFCSNNEKDNVLIVGWEERNYVSWWLVANPSHDDDKTTIPVGMGQHGIDDLCLAPTRSFTDMLWQWGPFWELAQPPHGWLTYSHLSVAVSKEELERLETRLEMGAQCAIDVDKPITVYDKNIMAHSRRFYLESYRKDREKNCWYVRFVRSDVVQES